MPREEIIHLVLRLGVAFAFLYPPLSALVNPGAWIGYFPTFLEQFFPNTILLLHIFGAFEIVIALWILSGKKIFIPSALATVILLAIVILNPSQMDVLFRDLSIALMSLALALGDYLKKKIPSESQLVQST